MIKAIYPGSFDPITLGHLDILKRIQPMFSEVTVVVANSQRKQYLFSLEERTDLVRENLKSLPGVKVDQWDGLMVDYAKKNGAKVIVRGIRAVADFEYEFAIANMNRNLFDSIETIVVFTRPEYSFVASSLVKEVAHHGGDLKNLVPANVLSALKQKKF